MRIPENETADKETKKRRKFITNGEIKTKNRNGNSKNKKE
jgi:hypothetical protein